jgi:hypothetical protein
MESLWNDTGGEKWFNAPSCDSRNLLRRDVKVISDFFCHVMMGTETVSEPRISIVKTGKWKCPLYYYVTLKLKFSEKLQLMLSCDTI